MLFRLRSCILAPNHRLVVSPGMRCMTAHQPQNVWLSALGLLTALLWTAQFSADWFVPHSDIRTAQLEEFELATVSHEARNDNSRVSRLESKPDPAASVAELFARIDDRNDPGLTAFAADKARRNPTATLPGIRAPPHSFST